MTTISLRDFYPELYDHDEFTDVPDEVFAALREYTLAEEAYRIRTYRHKAYYSLDYGDDIERDALLAGPSPYDEHEKKQEVERLYDALARLPKKQQRRIYARYFLGKSQTEIARSEGVSKMAVCFSISRGLKKLATLVKKFAP